MKFNFFSVAERPLTFFAYFLNAKKVGRRRLVIVPATAGGLPLFPHAASVPAPALAPVRSHFTCGETARTVTGPTFWVCRAKSGAAFRCAKPPCAVVRFAAMTSSPRTDVLACPAFALLSHSPTALLNIPALVAIRLHFAARNRAGRSLPPPGATCSLPHFRFAQMWPRIFPRGLPGYVPLFHGWPRARTPALSSVSS